MLKLLGSSLVLPDAFLALSLSISNTVMHPLDLMLLLLNDSFVLLDFMVQVLDDHIQVLDLLVHRRELVLDFFLTLLAIVFELLEDASVVSFLFRDLVLELFVHSLNFLIMVILELLHFVGLLLLQGAYSLFLVLLECLSLFL